MDPFTAPKFNESTERRLAVKLWTAFHKKTEATRPMEGRREYARFEGLTQVASDILGYGGTPFAVEMAVKEAYCVHVRDRGVMPSATSTALLPLWREALTDAVVAALRGIR